MSHAKGNPPRIVPPVGSGTTRSHADSHDDSEDKSGRTTFDDRGNAVWEWQTEDGDYTRDASTQRLKKLELPELSLEDTMRLRKLSGSAPKEGMLPGGGFNPYDRGTKSNDSGMNTRPAQQPVGQSIQSKYAATARKPVKDLKRLQEWMAMKERLANKKDDD